MLYARFKAHVRKGDFSTKFVLQQKPAIDEKKVISGKLSSTLLGLFIDVKMKLPMTPHDFPLRNKKAKKPEQQRKQIVAFDQKRIKPNVTKQ